MSWKPKPKVLIFVLCGMERSDWINPALFLSLLRLRSEQLDITIQTAYDLKPYEQARNFCVVNGKRQHADYVVQIDNDIVLPPNFAEILHETIASKRAVVGLKYGALPDGLIGMLSCHDSGLIDGNFRQTGMVGGGCLIIGSDVWKKIPGPWFRWLFNEDEQETRKQSEDIYFCELVQQHGFQIWTHKEAAGHLKTINLTSICKTLGHDR